MKVKIEKLDNFGRGITYINNKICFIENALINEEVEINITKENNKFIEAEVINYITKSPIRVKEECPYSSICGGCNLSHISFNDENNFKEQKVKELLTKFTNIDSNIVDSISYHDRDKYRNKIILHGNNKTLGLYKKHSNEVIEIDKCLLVDDKVNDLINLIKSLNNELVEVIIKETNDNKDLMVSIKGNINNIDLLLDKVKVLIINDKYYTKDKVLINPICNYKYYESINSFFQVNKTLTKNLYDEALNIVKCKNPNKVLDLYCGTGTIGIYVSKYCNEVIGIDYNKSNIEDANNNKILNNINNINFICDKVENKIDTFKDIDLIIVDPPRAGLDNKTKDYLKIINPETIIYISCDPVTLFRDLKDLEDTYNVLSIKPYNMFPRCYHVENVVLLCHKENK
jgi:23S rRNA (uracil1939-C5)-methyltransferase